MRFAYADPPYPGNAWKYEDHPDYAGEVDHELLIEQLETFDGWVLHTGSNNLPYVISLLAGVEGWRTMAWVKPFAAFKRNVPVAYAWEPVFVKPVRKPVVGRLEAVKPLRDWLAESITLKRGLTGAKPERVCWWLFEAVGLEPEDELVDLFPGSGAVTDAWATWKVAI